MSLRLASLDPNEPRAAKDCRNCNRRRIKCDRSIPACKKCGLRSLECPGYGLRIRWDQGVASRGKLSGMKIPVLGGQPAAPLTKVPTPPRNESPVPQIRTAATFPARVDITSLLSSPLPAVAGSSQHDAQRNAAGMELNNPHALNLDLSTRQVPSPLEDPAAQRLLTYYDHVVSATFPWIEGPVNYWRTVMIPLSLEYRPLLLALLAMAAEHYSSRTGLEWIFEDGSCGSAQLRDDCLHLLSEDLKIEVSGAQPSQERNSSGLLAAILALCNLEMVRSDSALWRVHWSAARAITRRWTSAPNSAMTLNSNERCLVIDAFVYDAFASCTTFDGYRQISNDAVHPQDVDIFIEYFRLVQDITRFERARFEDPGHALPGWLQDRHTIRAEFEAVRRRNLGFHQLFQLASEERRQDFDALIDMYHFSAMLYGFQVALHPVADLLLRRECAEGVVDSLNRIKSPVGIQQCFVWPLFIVATEARGMEEAQKFCEWHLLDAMAATGFGNCYPALEYLRRFWKTTPGLHPTWITFAREESARGIKLLVI
ncbi:hypothetical protein BST61_g4656 [Cercospora zeina]